ncbi:alpha/beta hydrolase [Spirosoma taeanense]|uniref:Alpha/beta hydrolase n=1 Tax=Spirosoma taeanense TaxID=2735870 RepID=A0A6M5Y4L0_9BACT|nr:alpha/beta hydrolase [Spirosoma taeanense]QJW89458.1 alpha/beta hydrolase [Spirosoma taeanense]
MTSLPSMTLLKKTLSCLLLCASAAQAQQVIPLYSGKAPGSETWDWPEKENTKNMFNTRVVYNVTSPSITAYLPDRANANGTAVIICPGGAFHTLSIDSEGIDVAKWLNAKGVAAFVLKYRLAHSLTDDPVAELLPKLRDFKKLDAENAPVVPLAIADGRKAIDYVREHAAEFGVNPNRIGIMGFSAGGTVTAGVAFSYTPTNRPAFVAPIYAYMGALDKTAVPTDAPPLFAVTATDDQLVPASNTIQLYTDWVAAGKGAELHSYAKGGHGFGMRKQNLPVDSWIERFGEWLAFGGFLTRVP